MYKLKRFRKKKNGYVEREELRWIVRKKGRIKFVFGGGHNGRKRAQNFM